ncbi:MAG: hypothetical protein K6A23_02975 [Butyrivibrio sp.]|nr:hypothetical protein [Butyrivibrio sp.]
MRVSKKQEQIEERKEKRKFRKRMMIIGTVLISAIAGCAIGYVYRDKIGKLVKKTDELKDIRADIDNLKEKLVETTNAIGESVNEVLF